MSACDEMAGHIGDLATAYRAIGKACNDYAQAVDDHHQEIEDELASFIEWTIGIEAAGAVVGFFTLGIGEGAAQAAEAAEVANAWRARSGLAGAGDGKVEALTPWTAGKRPSSQTPRSSDQLSGERVAGAASGTAWGRSRSAPFGTVHGT